MSLTDVQNGVWCSAVSVGRGPEFISRSESATTERFCTRGVQNEVDRCPKWGWTIENGKSKMKNIVVHKTLKRAQNKKQQSADNCAGRSYPLTAMSFLINFMFFMVKKRFWTGLSKLSKMGMDN